MRPTDLFPRHHPLSADPISLIKPPPLNNLQTARRYLADRLATSTNDDERQQFQQDLTEIDSIIARASEPGAYINSLAKQHSNVTLQIELKRRQIAHYTAIRNFTRKLLPRPLMTTHSRMKAHEIFEQLDTPYCVLLGGMDFDKFDMDIITITKWIHGIEHAHKFDFRSCLPEDIEPSASFATELASKSLLVQPYPECWYEFDFEGDITMGLLHVKDKCKPFFRVKDAGWASWTHGNLNSVVEATGDMWHQYLNAAIVLVMSKSMVKHQFSHGVKLQNARIRTGKPLLFNHTIVELRGISVTQAGVEHTSHRSPHMHWRRGHIRHYKNGLERAIAPMLVGKGDMVTHEYRWNK